MPQHLRAAALVVATASAGFTGGWLATRPPARPEVAVAADIAATSSAEPAGPPATPPASVEVFDDRLEPYGDWVIIEGYGRVWRPRVAVTVAGWSPYVYGHWVFTDYGWMWVTDHDWGSDPYRYGRWTVVAGTGWVWCPDTVWGPAWVEWRWCDGYVGWAPLPYGFRWGVRAEPAVVVSAFVFVPTPHFLDARVSLSLVEPAARVAIFERSRPILETRSQGGFVFGVGPEPRAISAATGVEVRAAVVVSPGREPSRAEPPRDVPRPEPPRHAEPPHPRPAPPHGGGHPGGHP
jgi:hypothetical protein